MNSLKIKTVDSEIELIEKENGVYISISDNYNCCQTELSKDDVKKIKEFLTNGRATL